MNAPLQLSVPENAQVHIHIGSAGHFTGPAFHGVAAHAEAVAQQSRPKLLLTLAAMGLFGLGYVVHGVISPPAAATSTTRDGLAHLTPPFGPSNQGAPGPLTPTLDPRLAAPLPPTIQMQRPAAPSTPTLPPNPSAAGSPAAANTASPGTLRNPFGLE